MRSADLELRIAFAQVHRVVPVNPSQVYDVFEVPAYEHIGAVHGCGGYVLCIRHHARPNDLRRDVGICKIQCLRRDEDVLEHTGRKLAKDALDLGWSQLDLFARNGRNEQKNPARPRMVKQPLGRTRKLRFKAATDHRRIDVHT